MIIAKECTKCGELKPLDSYTKAAKGKYGLDSKCKDCARAYRQANKERDRVSISEWAKRNPDKVRASRVRNAEKISQRQAEYRDANRDVLNLKQVEYIKDNPHVRWEYRYKRRVREYGLEPYIESFTKEDLVREYGDACSDCGEAWDTLEHVTPVAAGGAHTLSNCRPLCFPCNRRRWREYQRAAIAAYTRQEESA